MKTSLPRNSIRCQRFTVEAFRKEVDAASDRSPDVQPSPQLEYLATYLDKDIGATWMVVEEHYVDRHFTDELTRYYSSCFRKPVSECARIHFFRGEEPLDDAAFDALLSGAPDRQLDANGADARWRQFNAALSERYLGFTVIRPLASVPIGRTVLKPRADDPSRRFETLVPHTVHLAGCELSVRGVAWQQQDWAVAACATTAIWSALQRVARYEAQRVPTPPEITTAAVRFSVGQQRPLPSPGLTTQQISDALHAFHFGPSCFRVSDHPGGSAVFALTLNIYLRSGIPVILAVKNPSGAHALTAVGYRHDPNGATYPVASAEHIDLRAGAQPARPCNLDYREVYLHDDRVGPYARGFLKTANNNRLTLTIDRPGATPDVFDVVSGAAPLYPKVRTDAGELIRAASVVKSYVWAVAGGKDVAVEMFFDRSGSYLWSLYRPEVDRTKLARFQREVALSRYVAVTRWSIGGTLFMDVVWDTTDRIRGEQWQRHILACVCYDQSRRDVFAELVQVVAPDVPAM